MGEGSGGRGRGEGGNGRGEQGEGRELGQVGGEGCRGRKSLGFRV
jgi:hypothetical protein